MSTILCSFSGDAAELPKGKRKPMDILAVLARNPRVSCFDLSDLDWLANGCHDLRVAGLVEYDITTVGFPWVRYPLTDKGRAAIGAAVGQADTQGAP